MAFLREHGAESFLLNLHHGPETVRQKVTAWAADRFPVEFTHEPEILGTGGGSETRGRTCAGGRSWPPIPTRLHGSRSGMRSSAIV